MNIVLVIGLLVTLATGIPVLIQLLRNHPRGLIILFFAEMWERFSYYGMRAILIFYLTQHFLFDDKFSNAQYGSYTSLVYLLPLIGGFLADKYLGTRKAVAFGALLLVAGHLTMAIEGKSAQQVLNYQGSQYVFQVEGAGGDREVKLQVGDEAYDWTASADGGLAIKDLPADAPLPAVLAKGSYSMEVAGRDQTYVNIFYLALALIIMGVGFLKPNISAIVGQLYPQGDPRRDSGFTLYYYGINLGSFWAALMCGWLGQNVGWWAGFGLAGIGMLLGFIVFVVGKPLLQGKGEPPAPAKLAEKVVGPINRETLIYLASLAGVAVVWVLVQRYSWVGIALTAGTAASLAYIGWFMVTQCNKIQRERMGLALILILGSVVFFTLFEQAGSSLNLFADRNVDLTIVSHPLVWFNGAVTLGNAQQLAAAGIDPASTFWVNTGLAASQTQSFNAGFILIFAPIFAWAWSYMGARNMDIGPMVKFGLGLMQVGLGFLVLVWGASFAGDDYRLPLIFMGIMYLLHTTGELFLSPVGLSEITKLSVSTVVAFMMAVWFLASSI
ncbi:MAG: oligopeptide:H+ symporter, partial [Caulobacter sp.]